MDKLRMVIFGASSDGRSFLQQIKPLVLLGLMEVVAFADNDSRITGHEIEGITIINPAQIAEHDFDYVIVAPIFYDEISRQLIDLGISETKIIPHYNSYRHYFSAIEREYGNVKIGKYSYYKPSTKVWNCDIGKFCHIGPNCLIGQAGHDPGMVTTYPLKYHFSNSISDCSKDPTADKKRGFKRTIIKNDVYIGEGVVIFGGITIGNGAIVASRAVVTKDIPDYCIVGGIPAKVIGKRFPDHITDSLLKIKWWDWPEEKILENLETFELDVEKFVALHS